MERVIDVWMGGWIAVVISKLLKHHSKAKRMAPTYSRGL